MKTKKFWSWNVNGIRAVRKKGFADIVRNSGAHIFAVQESKAQKEQLTDDLLNIEGYESYWFGAQKKGYSSVGVYTKDKPANVIYGLGIEKFDIEGRTLTLEYENFYFVNCYFPNAQHELKRIDYKIEFNNCFKEYTDNLLKKKSVIMCGDFNVAHKPVDLANPESNKNNPGYSAAERQWMDDFINSGYIDTFRKFNKSPENYTWWSYMFNARAKNIGWRIDYFFVNKKSENNIAAAEILKDIYGSDHCPVTLEYRSE